MCSHSHQSPTLSFVLWPSCLLTFSWNLYPSLSCSVNFSPMDVESAYKPPLVSPVTESTFPYIDYSDSVSWRSYVGGCFHFFASFSFLNLLQSGFFCLSIVIETTITKVIREVHLTKSKSYICLFFSFLAPQQYSIPPSVSKHLLLLPHTVITSDLHDTKFVFLKTAI